MGINVILGLNDCMLYTLQLKYSHGNKAKQNKNRLACTANTIDYKILMGIWLNKNMFKGLVIVSMRALSANLFYNNLPINVHIYCDKYQ